MLLNAMGGHNYKPPCWNQWKERKENIGLVMCNTWKTAGEENKQSTVFLIEKKNWDSINQSIAIFNVAQIVKL